METLFDTLHVNYSEMEYFNSISDEEKLTFAMQLFDQAFVISNGVDLRGFFDNLENGTFVPETETLYESPEYENDPNRVDVMIDEDNIMIESNSLKAIKHVMYKFAESGYLMRRDLELEKMFKRDKMTKYLRIFHVIDHINTICTN